MARARKKKTSLEEYCSISVEVEKFDAETEVSVNMDVYQPEYAYITSEQDPLYPETTIVNMQGSILAPRDRAGNICRITLFGNNSLSSGVMAKLDDAHARDQHRARMYRTYRGRTLPVYNPPKGLALLEKVRGQSEWCAWIRVTREMAMNTLLLLSTQAKVFIAIHECKSGRKRWIRSIGFQTTNPELD